MPGAPRKKTTAKRAAPTKARAKKAAKAARKAASPARAAKATKKPAKKAAKASKKPAKPAKAIGKKAIVKKAVAKKAAKVVAKPKAAPKAVKAATGKPTAVATVAKATSATKAVKPPIVTKVPAARLPQPSAEAPLRTKPGTGRKKEVICELSGFEVMPSAPALSPKTLDRLRQKLLEEKQRLAQQADELSAEAEQLAVEREAGDTQFDEESGEGDTVNVERERDLLLSASARQVVEEIDEALTRIKKGTYGVCKYAGRKLPLERLEAIPWANVCVDCKARAERRR
jgi:RNA polymerase-binding protein DksA